MFWTDGETIARSNQKGDPLDHGANRASAQGLRAQPLGNRAAGQQVGQQEVRVPRGLHLGTACVAAGIVILVQGH